ncbi:2OG-Fe dioxygenase family protein [Acinetobacter courvalinii]|uniref:2OG-Fe dioxygenase family protein n=1 Tax=Acinetobacter courvalinii TaxID=280147 RepID=UPI0021D2579C|nr:2OG-Fe dioxygenase family protein [Acinetobacter courvalinii]MCU4578344.1 2OG-Fe dioxygenase family protein [Acinetobacter courvalinii]
MSIENSIFDEIDCLRTEYQNKKYLFISGSKMASLLKRLGASNEDLQGLKKVSDLLEKDPTLKFRKSRNGRFVFNPINNEIYRTESQRFVLSKQEDFVRYDSGKLRNFYGLSESLTRNSAFQNLLKLKYCLIQGVEFKQRPFLNYDSNQWVTTVFNLRTITTNQLRGEPALEGIHTDGVDHTMTILFGHQNMKKNGSAITYLHSMDEKTGIKFEEANEDYILCCHQHWDFLDTLMIIDHERKHSLTSVEQEDKNMHATRDMLILFTRKPAKAGHVSYNYDSLKPHPDYPIRFNALDVQRT